MTYLAGQKLRANDLRRIVARHRRTTSTAATAATTSATALKVCELSAPVLAGRLYRVGGSVALYVNGGAGNPIIEAQLTYTTNGAAPAATSTQLAVRARHAIPGGFPQSTDVVGYYAPSTDHTFKVLLSFYLPVAAGAASAVFYATAAWPLDFLIEDIGADPGSTGVNF